MIRTVLVVAALAIGVTAVSAQQDPIAVRKALMKQTGEQSALGGKMVKGEEPFDLAKAQAIFVQFLKTAETAPNLFPDNSKTGGDTGALPAIWQNKADFNARFAKLAADVKAAQAAVKDFDSFKAIFPTVTRNCGGCHENYRAKKS